MQVTAGKREKMDAFVTISLHDSREIQIESPVSDLFGIQQREAVRKALDFLKAGNCRVVVEDFQAADPVLTARVKAAVMRLRKLGGNV